MFEVNINVYNSEHKKYRFVIQFIHTERNTAIDIDWRFLNLPGSQLVA